MLLVIDVGNTNIVLDYLSELVFDWRIASDVDRTSDDMDYYSIKYLIIII